MGKPSLIDATSLRGTRHYWMKQHSRLIAMVEDLGLPSVFFTHSAADHQWPEFARLLSPDDPMSNSSHSRRTLSSVTGSSATAFYVDLLGASDYWFRFSGSIVAALTCMVWHGSRMHLTSSKSLPQNQTAGKGDNSSTTLTRLSAPPTQQCSLMGMMLTMPHQPEWILISLMQRSRIFNKI